MYIMYLNDHRVMSTNKAEEVGPLAAWCAQFFGHYPLIIGPDLESGIL